MQMLRRAAVLVAFAQQFGDVAASAGRDAARSPVEKVVKLLEDMKERITEDGKKEQALYDTYACWCEKTTARKAQAIEDAKNELRSLGQEILTQRAIIATKTSEIQQTTVDIKENEEAQKEATAIRQKENGAFMAEQSELQQAISALQKALIVLRSATGEGEGEGSALLQQRFMSSEKGLAAAGRAVVAVSALQDAVAAVPSRTLDKLEKRGVPVQRISLLRSYAEALAKSGGQASYTPQSGTITGILDEMYKTFATDLEDMVSEESDKQRAFEDLIATKQTELLELQDALKKAEEAKADAEKKLAEATQAYDDTEAQLKADVEFFDVTKTACQSKTDEWKTRKSLRDEELAGIGEALEILTSDEARELFGKAIKDGKATPGEGAAFFLQVASDAVPKEKAYAAIKREATRTKSLRLARVAAAIKLAKVGHFDQVIKSIDKLIEDLKAEQLDDIAKRDQCKEEYTKINSTISDLSWKIEVNQATIDKLTATIADLEAEKEQTIKDIQAVKDDIVAMKKTRQEENAAFLQARKDDEDAIVLLKQAKDAVAKFYEKNDIKMGPIQGGEGNSLLQQGPEFERSEDEAPDATFSKKGHRKGESKGVISILTMLIEDLGDEITVAQQEEEKSQLLYEEQLKAAEALQKDLEEKEVNLGQAISDRKEDKVEEEDAKKSNEDDKTGEENYKKEIKPDCDFAIEKFGERQTSRTAELDGLRQAKEFLAGYQPPVEDASLAQVSLRGSSRPVARHAFA